jgi:hypothetical protein
MDIRAHDGALYEWEGDVLALGVFEENLARTEDDKFLHPGLAELDYVMGGVLGELVRVFSPLSSNIYMLVRFTGIIDHICFIFYYGSCQ